MLYVGIDIGGTNIKYGLLNEKGDILEKGQQKTENKAEDILKIIVEIVKGYQVNGEIAGVGISAPGVIQDDGFMTTAGAIFELYGMNLKNKLQDLLQLPVEVENDVNSVALAERWIGNGKDHKHFLCLAVGTGIGGAVVINGDIYRGANAMAGEFGFMITEPIKEGNTRLSTLSLTGAISVGIIEKYQEKVPGDIDGVAVFQKAKEGDTVAKEVIDSFYDNLSRGFFNLISCFDPEIVLVGGAISSDEGFIREINQRVNDLKNGHRDLANLTFPSIVPCKFRNDAGIIGAAYKIMTAKK